MVEKPLNYSERQARQYEIFQQWVRDEGGQEWPTQLTTLLAEHQRARMDWLRCHVIGSVLEVGCNFGLVLAWVGGHYGVDIHPVNIELARLLAPDRLFQVAGAADLPFADKDFDTVMLPEVLEHLEFPDGVYAAIQEAKRVARVRVLFTCPDGRKDTTDACSMKHRWLFDDSIAREILTWLPGVVLKYEHGFALGRWDKR